MANAGEPRRGEVRRLDIEGASASHVLVLSEDDWNRGARDVVAIPLDASAPSRAPIRPGVVTVIAPGADGGDLTAKCDLVQIVPTEALGPAVEARLAPDWSERVAASLSRLLGVGYPLGSRRAPTGARTGRWWPRQGQVVYGPSYGGERKMVVVVSEDDWNVNNDYAQVVRLTSQARGRSSNWYVPISGGWLATPDIRPYPHTGMDQRTRPPVAAITTDQFDALTHRMIDLWGLDQPSSPVSGITLGF